LHDVCEDCPGWTFERLRNEGFSDEIIAALDAVIAPICVDKAGGNVIRQQGLFLAHAATTANRRT
jgi:hypothetical protein